MSENESPFNLFSSSKKNAPSKPKPFSPGPRPTEKTVPLIRNKEVEEMLQKIKEMQDDLNTRVERITRLSGVNHESVLKLSTTSFQTKEQLQKMHVDIKEFTEKVWGTIGPGIMPKVAEKDPVKNRKSKTLGARRNWTRIP